MWASALLTMVVGNFGALVQTNIKRMLAYSSIAHAGYLMVAITASSQIGTAAAMFYLAAYALMNIGAFAVVTHFSRQGEKFVNIQDLAGLGQKQPVTAGLFAICLLSLIGVPLTAGFFGKFYIFKAALDSHLVWLTVLGLLNSAVAAYYYLRIMVVMFMQSRGKLRCRFALERRHPNYAVGVRVGDAVARDLPVGAAELRAQFQRADKVTDLIEPIELSKAWSI